MPYVFCARKVLMASAHRSIGAAFLIVILSRIFKIIRSAIECNSCGVQKTV